MRPLDPPAGTAGSLRLLRAVLAASVLVPVLLFVGIFWHDRLEAQAEAEQRVRRVTLLLHEHGLKIFETVEQVLGRVDEYTRGLQWQEIGRSRELHQHMRNLAQQLPQLASVGLISPEGDVVSSSRTFPVQPTDVRDREYFRVHAERPVGLLFTPAIRGRVSGLPQFNMTIRRSNPPGGVEPFDGLVAVSVYTTYFTDFYRRIAPRESDVVGLFRADGALLVRHPENWGGGDGLGSDSRFMEAIAANPEEGLFHGRGVRDGVPRIIGYRRLGDYPVYILYGIAESEVSGAWADRTKFDLLFAVPATLGLMLTSWLALRRARREAEAVQRWAVELKAREALEDTLRQSQKMEALGQLTGGVAHDFNNLLTAAQTNLHLLGRRLAEGNGTETARYLDGAGAALERAGKLTRQLLAFSRQEAVNTQVLDIADALRNMSDLLERSLRADIALQWDIAGTPMRVEVDAVQFELAVLNLAVNACDAMPGGGTLRIAARPDGAATGGRVLVEVSDTGTGMAPEVQARAFEPFFTTKAADKGTGLGLSMVYGFARQSGGTAEIESEAGHGTLVRLVLPMTDRAPPPPPSVAPPPRAEDRAARVLVVEDNALVQLAIVEGLKMEGFDLLTADHGPMALEVLEREGRVDAVVSDVVMPHGMSGIVLARRIRELWPDTRILLISGYSPESLAGMGADTADDVLPKPFKPDQLANRVHALLRKEAALP
ncbi:hybrid sensor histidine kinase/response regulator [Azospirillum sp. SYSU D00513]|uniref:hybrid sensor histidine kinase/response regulator n=1 Tax=Azospirillum sp. SYSU D00513 TaxID=2812561 RepID=UPI00200035BC|nr:hybrid sensor histidine kinase/response regulator [Azospirillum sp. SYSU D00513]